MKQIQAFARNGLNSRTVRQSIENRAFGRLRVIVSQDKGDQPVVSAAIFAFIDLAQLEDRIANTIQRLEDRPISVPTPDPGAGLP